MSNYTGMAAPASNPTKDSPPTAKTVKKASTVGGNKKGTSAERRATHNAVERARRESLNVRFLQLAASLPSTCTVRRPSKSLIVNKSLEFVEQALNAEAILRSKIEELLQEERDMMNELNRYRQDQGQAIRQSDVDLSNLPKPLSAGNFKMDSQKALASIHRGSFTLGGEFEEDYTSGQASTSSVSSTGSPPNGVRASSHGGFSIPFGASPGLPESMESTSLPAGPYFADAINFPQANVTAYSPFATPSYYTHNSSTDHQPMHPQHNQQHLQQQHADSQSLFLSPNDPRQQLQKSPAPIIATSAPASSADDFDQLFGMYSLPEDANAGQMAQLSGSLSSNVTSAPFHSSSEMEASSQPAGFSTIASNYFFDTRYSAQPSTSTSSSD